MEIAPKNVLVSILSSAHIQFYFNTDTEAHYFVIVIGEDTCTENRYYNNIFL